AEYFAPGCKLMQLDADSWEIAKNFPVHIGLLAETKGSLAKIVATVKNLLQPHQERIAFRKREITRRRHQARKEMQVRLDAVPDTETEMSPETMMRTLVENLP